MARTQHWTDAILDLCIENIESKQKAMLDPETQHGIVDEKILRPFAARHGAAARLAQIERATALAVMIWANAK
jgi:hypothetical protein